MSRKHEIYIGTSGWSYEHWKENFYPEGLKATDWLSYYSQVFSTVEINTTFYHTPRVTTVEHWNEIVPENFLFSVKANRYITHRKRLHDCKKSLGIFYKSIEKFKTKIGPILIQLPPSFKANKERLIDFVHNLNKKYKYTFEFRHDTWFTDEIYEILTKHNLALCITDLHGKLTPEAVTADFVYIRLHGPQKAYSGSYGPIRLRKWKNKIEAWTKQADVFCYFDNDEKGYAIQDAKYLLGSLNKGLKLTIKCLKLD